MPQSVLQSHASPVLRPASPNPAAAPNAQVGVGGGATAQAANAQLPQAQQEAGMAPASPPGSPAGAQGAVPGSASPPPAQPAQAGAPEGQPAGPPPMPPGFQPNSQGQVLYQPGQGPITEQVPPLEEMAQQPIAAEPRGHQGVPLGAGAANAQMELQASVNEATEPSADWLANLYLRALAGEKGASVQSENTPAGGEMATATAAETSKETAKAAKVVAKASSAAASAASSAASSAGRGDGHSRRPVPAQAAPRSKIALLNSHGVPQTSVTGGLRQSAAGEGDYSGLLYAPWSQNGVDAWRDILPQGGGGGPKGVSTFGGELAKPKLPPPKPQPLQVKTSVEEGRYDAYKARLARLLARRDPDGLSEQPVDVALRKQASCTCPGCGGQATQFGRGSAKCGSCQGEFSAVGASRGYQVQITYPDGRKKIAAATDRLPGGLADGLADAAFNRRDLRKGMHDEQEEHTTDPQIAKEIAKDHLRKDPQAYDKEAREFVPGEDCAGCGASMEKSEEGYCNSCGCEYDTGKTPAKGRYHEGKRAGSSVIQPLRYLTPAAARYAQTDHGRQILRSLGLTVGDLRKCGALDPLKLPAPLIPQASGQDEADGEEPAEDKPLPEMTMEQISDDSIHANGFKLSAFARGFVAQCRAQLMTPAETVKAARAASRLSPTIAAELEKVAGRWFSAPRVGVKAPTAPTGHGWASTVARHGGDAIPRAMPSAGLPNAPTGHGWASTVARHGGDAANPASVGIPPVVRALDAASGGFKGVMQGTSTPAGAGWRQPNPFVGQGATGTLPIDKLPYWAGRELGSAGLGVAERVSTNYGRLPQSLRTFGRDAASGLAMGGALDVVQGQTPFSLESNTAQLGAAGLALGGARGLGGLAARRTAMGRSLANSRLGRWGESLSGGAMGQLGSMAGVGATAALGQRGLDTVMGASLTSKLHNAEQLFAAGDVFGAADLLGIGKETQQQALEAVKAKLGPEMAKEMVKDPAMQAQYLTTVLQEHPEAYAGAKALGMVDDKGQVSLDKTFEMLAKHGKGQGMMGPLQGFLQQMNLGWLGDFISKMSPLSLALAGGGVFALLGSLLMGSPMLGVLGGGALAAGMAGAGDSIMNAVGGGQGSAPPPPATPPAAPNHPPPAEPQMLASQPSQPAETLQVATGETNPGNDFGQRMARTMTDLQAILPDVTPQEVAQLLQKLGDKAQFVLDQPPTVMADLLQKLRAQGQ